MSGTTQAGPDRECVTITVNGRFDGSTVALVRQALRAAISDTSADVTIDLGADWIDLPALAVLAHAHRQLHEQDRRLLVYASSDRVRRVLAVTGLNRVIAVRPRAVHLVA